MPGTVFSAPSKQKRIHGGGEASYFPSPFGIAKGAGPRGARRALRRAEPAGSARRSRRRRLALLAPLPGDAAAPEERTMPTEFFENVEAPRKAVLAAVDTGEYDVEISLEELRELAKTAGYPVVGTATQRLQSPVAATFMGSGRLLELKDYMEATEADLIIFDEELSPAQLRNIEELCDCPVLDRTMLILDIFAARAVSGEGKLQVELARLQYQLPRLAGRGVQLSRQGGGGAGGTGARRGAGETKLEVDRRHIRRRIDALKTELAALARRREQRRARRKKDGITTVAIVGYTNVGKSTLLNTLTEAGVLAEDKLFATLDPTSRALALPDGRSVMLIDTVGLVRRLPHQLVEAFHSTLEEAANADLILSVCDITSPELLEQRAVTERLLEELGVEGTPVITVLNKCDAAPDAENEPYKGCVRISAKTGYGLPQLLAAIAETLPPGRIRCRLCLPYTEGGLLHRLEQQGQIFSREYTAEGTLLDAEVEQRDWRLFESYLKTED